MCAAVHSPTTALLPTTLGAEANGSPFIGIPRIGVSSVTGIRQRGRTTEMHLPCTKIKIYSNF
jgi:hypothetical protein